MKSIVVFDSNYGNTKKIADIIAKTLEAKSISVSDVSANNLESLDLLIVGCPIIGWMPTQKMQTFLSKLNHETISGVKFATFDTRVKLFIHGDAMKKIANKLTSLGAIQTTSPMAFYVKNKEGILFENEIAKATSWAELIERAISKAAK